jgi:hypothetical protein
LEVYAEASSAMPDKAVQDRSSIECLPVTGIAGMGPDTPTVTNDIGAKQSAIPYAFHLIDGLAMFKMAEVLHAGAIKYGIGNWRGLPVEDHINHLLAHAFAYLAGDESDDHLSHILCRATFAQAVALEEHE